ncbi:MAG: hypothetical protein ACI4O7_11380 [Aristaeellaceae bacterium]
MIRTLLSLMTALTLLPGLAVSRFPTRCTLCDGQGICVYCGGEGTMTCAECFDGGCLYCHGGQFPGGIDDQGNLISRECDKCEDGRCTRCGGTHQMPCIYCEEGVCPLCDGRGHW